MYKEINAKKKAPVVINIFIVLSLMIALSNMLETIKIKNFSLGIITNPALGIITTAFIVFQIFRCRVSYKYSIIGDQLIIHRLTQNDHQAVKCINLNDIKYVGKPSGCMGKYALKETKSYSCTLRIFNALCCVYKTDEGYKKFYFQPSEKLVDKIKGYMQ